MAYKINNVVYQNTYDLSLMDHQIKYALATSVEVKKEKTIKNERIFKTINKFIHYILYENVAELYYFLYKLDTTIINKLRFKLITYTKHIINGVGKNNKKPDFIKNLCMIIFKNLSVIEFMSFFENKIYKICYDFIDKLYGW